MIVLQLLCAHLIPSCAKRATQTPPFQQLIYAVGRSCFDECLPYSVESAASISTEMTDDIGDGVEWL
jgi:hypothetical protein